MSDEKTDLHERALDCFQESFHMAVQGCLQVMVSANAYRVADPENKDCTSIKAFEEIAQECVGKLGKAELALAERKKS